MSITIHPVGRRYLLEMEDIEGRKSNGGIYIPDSSGETTRVCKIIGVGEAEWDSGIGNFVKPKFAVGERVLISAYGGFNIDAKTYGYIGMKHKLVNESEIMARIEEKQDG